MSRKPGHPAPRAARHSGAWQSAVLAALIAATTAAPPDASAWGADGHRLIAEVVEARLSAPARAEIDRLLALGPGATLAVEERNNCDFERKLCIMESPI